MASENDFIIRILPVVEIEDEQQTDGTNVRNQNRGGRRIKVRLKEDNQYKTNDDLPWVSPFIPKYFQVTPKVGEMVLVMLQTVNGVFGNRFYVGPIVSQDYFLNTCQQYDAMSLLKGTSTRPLPHPKNNSNNNGTYPNEEDVAIQSRGNSALWLRKEEARLLCGFKKNPFIYPEKENADPGSLEFNRENLGYIQMKYGNFVDNKNKEYHSVTNIVSDRINLLSACEKSGVNVSVNDQEGLITDDEQKNVASNCERMVYGDSLISFLEKFREVFAEHTHHYYNDPQVMTEKDNADFWQKDLSRMLCDNIRIK